MTRRTLLSASVALALRQQNLDAAARLIQARIDSGEVAAAVLDVRRRDFRFVRAFGAAKTPDAVFLLASITKPMTATGLMVLVDRGRLSIDDPVHRYIPEFHGGDRDKILIRHILTHTSGLPDMLPENTQLRERHAPLSEFVAGTCRVPLLFPPGTQCKYQSMGLLLASEIAHRITKQPFPEFLHDNVFKPLGMSQTSLGLGGRTIASTMQVQDQPPNDWNANSVYWRNLGNPWGGVHSTTADLSRLLAYFAGPDDRVMKRATAASMVTNHNVGLNQPWGLGWMVAKHFGQGCSDRTFGHNGATGTEAWFDPASEVSSVLLTTKPLNVSEKMLLTPVADKVSTAF